MCGCCPWSTALNFSGDSSATRGRFSWFDRGYMFCISTGRLEELHTFSTLRQTRILIAFLSILFEWRRVPSRCFWMQFYSAQFALGILDVFLELHVADSCDDGVDFSPYFYGFFGLLFEVEALPIHPEVLWIYTLAHMSLNNNNNNTIWRGSVLTGEEPPLHSGELEACSHPSRRPNPIPAIPPYVVRTPHLHGAPTTEETVKL